MMLCIVLGTRPEIIKMSPVIQYCEDNKIEYFIVHTGQHYSFEMDKVFFDELELPQPKYNLEAGSNDFRMQIGIMKVGIMEVLLKEKPDWVLVQGDTNSVLAGALAAKELNINLAHIEAGLRSHEIAMIEETNRITTDHMSTFLYAPSKICEEYLLEEGIPKDKIIVCGNTIVDALFRNKIIAQKRPDKFSEFSKGKYFVLTLHRPENVDYKEKLENILEGLRKVYDEFRIPILFPMHPRTKIKLEQFNLSLPEGIRATKPAGYLDFLNLMAKASLILTDSGGIQEEASILKVPCVTVRNVTERHETVEIGANTVCGTDSENILSGAKKMIHKKRAWENPYGDGDSAKQIVDHILTCKTQEIRVQYITHQGSTR